ncbi:hypothetical protein B7494_g8094 [Chlorociboria aeruginascens]|nr:hypothetical protein B7494_g8094 [Chlorociboria aeruginascens]
MASPQSPYPPYQPRRHSQSSDPTMPPAPPPKPSSQEVSRRSTPASAPTQPPPPEHVGTYGIGSEDPRSTQQARFREVAHAQRIADPGEHWLPQILEDQTKQDLADVLGTPELLAALAHSTSTSHPSIAVSQEPLQAALTENISLASHLVELEARLTHLRSSTQAQLLSTHALERQWRQKQSDMDRALAPFSPSSLYQRLSQGVQEQEMICRALEESYLEGDGGTATEREALEWVRRSQNIVNGIIDEYIDTRSTSYTLLLGLYLPRSVGNSTTLKEIFVQIPGYDDITLGVLLLNSVSIIIVTIQAFFIQISDIKTSLFPSPTNFRVKMVKFLTSFAAIVGLVSALPSAVVQRSPEDGSQYYLKTKVISGDATKDGLYLEGYHITAGGEDATLTTDVTQALPGFLNGTYQQFVLSGSPSPNGLELPLLIQSNAQIYAGYGDGGFSFNASGLISSNPEWRGWLACDWSHLVPQLFWQYFFTDYTLPPNCAIVELHPEAI